MTKCEWNTDSIVHQLSLLPYLRIFFASVTLLIVSSRNRARFEKVKTTFRKNRSNNGTHKMSLALRGSRILSIDPCAADIASLIVVKQISSTAVSCIDASGELSILSSNSSETVRCSCSAVCQVQAPPGELWVGCSEKRGIAIIDINRRSTPQQSNDNTMVVARLDAFNEIVTQLCVILPRTINAAKNKGGEGEQEQATTIASIGTQGVACIWDIEERVCLVSAQLAPKAVITPIFAMCCHVTDDGYPASLWMSDSRGTVAIVDPLSLVVMDKIEAKKSITSLVSLPGKNSVWAGTEEGSVLVLDASAAPRRTASSSIQISSGVPITAMCRRSSSSLSSSPLSAHHANDGESVWIATMDGAVRLWCSSTFTSTFVATPPTERVGAAAGADEDARSYTCCMLSIAVRAVGSRSEDEWLISGGTSKIVTQQTFVAASSLLPSTSPVRQKSFAARDNEQQPAATAPALPPAATGMATGSVDASDAATINPFVKREQLAKSEKRVNALIKRVAELELDLMQAQAIGAELTKRILAPAPPAPQQQQQQQLQQFTASTTQKQASPSPARNAIPSSTSVVSSVARAASSSSKASSISVGIQVDSLSARSVSDYQQEQEQEAAAAEEEAMTVTSTAALDAQLALRVEQTEVENGTLREQLAAAQVQIDEQQQELQHMHESATRPMDDYELRCMQRLILENEKLRAELSAARNHYSLSQQQQQQATIEGRAPSSNLLTVCFLTLRSVLGHHLAAQVVLAAIGDQQQQQHCSSDDGDDDAGDAAATNEEEDKANEVETIEKLVYELAMRVHPSHKLLPEASEC